MSIQQCWDFLKTAETRVQASRSHARLAFEEDDGWVIVDWKTDDVSDEAILAARRDLYRRQVDTYAECWETLIGKLVTQRGRLIA